MKLRLSIDDINGYKEKYSNASAAAGFAEEPKFIGLPKYYVVILDEENLTLVEMTLGLKEKDVTAILLSQVNSVKVSGTMIKKAVINTQGGNYKLQFKPLAVGNGSEQKDLLNRIDAL